MFGLGSLDLLIGLVTVYLTMALACTALVEVIAGISGLRANNLEAALKEFLNGNLAPNQDFVEAFYAHPLVQSLSVGAEGRPTYIPPAVVSQVVRSLLTANDAAMSVKDAVNKLPGTPESNRIKGLLTTLEMQAKGDIEAFRTAVEKHFDSVMDRATGWVKRHQTIIALTVSFVLVFAANVDTFELASSLSSSPELRAKMVSIAEQQLKHAPANPEGKNDDSSAQAAAAKSTAAKAGDAKNGTSQPEVGKPGGAQGATSIGQVKNSVTDAGNALAQAKLSAQAGGLQFGWKAAPVGAGALVLKLIGLLITTFAVSLGAPFWFDTLQRVMKVRTAGVSPRDK